MIKKNILAYFVVWVILIMITFFVSYLMNVSFVDGIDTVTGKSFGGRKVNWVNIILSLVVVSAIYAVIVWKKSK